MELPTYTNIWRIEKRLYKLYDFRLPMPLPIGQIAVFAAIAVPYVVILKVIGLPFSHTLLWLYILPPGALAWLITRPVLEGKRLPELVHSQVRYLSEPRTWCRMAPLAEKEEITVTARVWRRAEIEIAELADAEVAETAAASRWPASTAPGTETAEVETDGVEIDDAETDDVQVADAGTAVASQSAMVAAAEALPPPAAYRPERSALMRHLPTGPVSAWPKTPARADRTPPPPASAPAARAVPVPPPVREAPRSRPVVTVTGNQHAERPIRMVERALGNPAERRAAGWRDQVVVVPGGHRPGQPDQMQRDRARARLPVPGEHRIVVLGCTVGAGQTMTALLTGELLASLRDDQVAALDLNPGPGSLAERARAVPALTGSRPPAPSRLEVVTRETAAREAGAPRAPRPGEDLPDVTKIFELVSARYPLTLADPGAAVVPRVLATASQLILVSPASQDAASALATTREWLEAHGHAGLAEGAIIVLNGVSRHTMPYVEQAEAVASGRCRAIVRVPWDDHLKKPEPERTARSAPGAHPSRAAGPLSLAALQAYTALAGVLVTALASVPEQLRDRP